MELQFECADGGWINDIQFAAVDYNLSERNAAIGRNLESSPGILGDNQNPATRHHRSPTHFQAQALRHGFNCVGFYVGRNSRE